MSDAYDMIARFLRNNLGDDDYADFSAALDSLCVAAPQQAEAVPPGYAGVMVWVGNKQAVRIVIEAALQHEALPGLALTDAAVQTIAAVQESHVDS